MHMRYFTLFLLPILLLPLGCIKRKEKLTWPEYNRILGELEKLADGLDDLVSSYMGFLARFEKDFLTYREKKSLLEEHQQKVLAEVRNAAAVLRSSIGKPLAPLDGRMVDRRHYFVSGRIYLNLLKLADSHLLQLQVEIATAENALSKYNQLETTRPRISLVKDKIAEAKKVTETDGDLLVEIAVCIRDIESDISGKKGDLDSLMQERMLGKIEKAMSGLLEEVEKDNSRYGNVSEKDFKEEAEKESWDSRILEEIERYLEDRAVLQESEQPGMHPNPKALKT